MYKDTTESLKTLPADPFKTSLLEVNEGPLVPWRFVQMEGFSASSGAEWLHKASNDKNLKQSFGSVTHCGDKNFMLGGHCRFEIYCEIFIFHSKSFQSKWWWGRVISHFHEASFTLNGQSDSTFSFH